MEISSKITYPDVCKETKLKMWLQSLLDFKIERAKPHKQQRRRREQECACCTDGARQREPTASAQTAFLKRKATAAFDLS